MKTGSLLLLLILNSQGVIHSAAFIRPIFSYNSTSSIAAASRLVGKRNFSEHTNPMNDHLRRVFSAKTDLYETNFDNTNDKNTNEMDLHIKELLRKKAKNSTFTIKINPLFPTKTWAQFFNLNETRHVEDIFNHFFNTMQFTFPELTAEEKTELTKKIIQTKGSEVFIKGFDPVSFGGSDIQKLRTINLARGLFLPAMIKEIKKDNEAVKYLSQKIDTIELVTKINCLQEGVVYHLSKDITCPVEKFLIMTDLHSGVHNFMYNTFKDLLDTYRNELVALKQQADEAELN